MHFQIMDKIINQLIIRDQAIVLVNVIDEIITNLYSTKFNTDKYLKDNLNPTIYVALIEFLTQNKRLSKNTYANQLIQLKKLIQKIPVVKITIAVEPSMSLIERLTGWFDENYRHVLVDYKVDKNLLAGAIIEFNGKYKNYSIINSTK
jgi:F0F1-type ATP synthase delta subunit